MNATEKPSPRQKGSKGKASAPSQDGLGASACSPLAHDQAWQRGFVLPIAKEMKKRGVAYLVIAIRKDGKASYTLEPVEEYVPMCLKCGGDGLEEIQNGPYFRKCPHCAGTGKANTQVRRREGGESAQSPD